MYIILIILIVHRKKYLTILKEPKHGLSICFTTAHFSFEHAEQLLTKKNTNQRTYQFIFLFYFYVLYFK